MKTSTIKNQNLTHHLFRENLSKIILFAVLILSVNSHAQYKRVKGSGTIITQTRTVDAYSEISISGDFNVQLIKGKEGTVTIEASDNLMEFIETEVKNGLLKIKPKTHVNIRNSKKIHITVTVEEIESLILSGSGSIVSAGALQSSSLSVKISGSGSMKINATTTNLIAAISGSGSLKISGKSDTFSCTVSGSGNINGLEFLTKITTAKISGSGNVKVHAINEIHAKTSGSGNIIYVGNPTIVKVQSSGSGSIKKQK